MALAATTIRSPMFDATEFGRVKAQYLAGYEQAMSSAEGIASRTWSRAMYAPGAPYSRSSAGTATTLGAITRDDVVAWHSRMYAPANTTILFVGDISYNDAVAMATRLFGDWSVPTPALTLPANPYRTAGGSRVILVDRPGSVQSSIYVGVPGIATTDPEFSGDRAEPHPGGGLPRVSIPTCVSAADSLWRRDSQLGASERRDVYASSS